MIVHDKCSFVDQQNIKLQEAPDMVPVGELPRHVLLSADRCVCPSAFLPQELMIWSSYLTGKVVPGTRVIATGIYSTFQAGKSVRASPPLPSASLTSSSQKSGGAIALRTPYLRVLGLEIDTDGRGRGARNFTAEEEEEFGEMARGEGFYERFSKSIAPSIFGSDGAFFLHRWEKGRS